MPSYPKYSDKNGKGFKCKSSLNGAASKVLTPIQSEIKSMCAFAEAKGK